MAQIALIDATDGTATAVRAALGRDAVALCRSGSVPSGVVLVIAELDDAASAGALAPSLAGTQASLLLLVDRPSSVDLDAFGDRDVAVLKKPFDLLDLRRHVRALLDRRPAATSGPDAEAPALSSWLDAPRIAPEAAATLAAARRLDGAVWIVGEPGTGIEHVAAALAFGWDPQREPVVWQESDSISSVLARAGEPGRVLWVPALDERPLREQRSFERFLALEPGRRVVVTSGDHPELAVAAGTLLRSLHDVLSRLSLRLAPLRERRGDVAVLAAGIAGNVARAVFGAGQVVLADDARRALENYPWPGNLAELDAVVTRSVIACGAAAARGVELASADLRFAPAHLAPLDLGPDAADDVAGDSPVSARRAVVVALGEMAAARAARPSDATSASATQVTGIPRPAVQTESGVEALLAAFAHDIRNPMSTIKTFAGLQAASAAEGSTELARLAVEACERVDDQLDFLQRYAELAPAAATRVDIAETLGEAIDAAGGAGALELAARRALWARTDPALVRFAADAIVAECVSRARSSGGGPQTGAVADLSGSAAVEIRIPVGGAAVDRLEKWVEGPGLPWRLALARGAARRTGGDLVVETEDGQMRLLWRLPSESVVGANVDGDGSEERSNDQQAGSPDRRRRSRGS